MLGIVLARVQNLALGLTELREVCTGPRLKAVQVPLDGIASLQRFDLVLVVTDLLLFTINRSFNYC